VIAGLDHGPSSSLLQSPSSSLKVLNLSVTRWQCCWKQWYSRRLWCFACSCGSTIAYDRVFHLEQVSLVLLRCGVGCGTSIAQV